MSYSDDNHEPPFKVGDTVRLKNGTAWQRIIEIKWLDRPIGSGHQRRVYAGWAVRAVYKAHEKYQSGYYDRYGTSVKWRSADDYVLIPQRKPEPEEAPMTKLYTVLNTDPPRYGTFLTKDSKGRMVLEMKPDGTIQAFKAAELEEVMPYTVELTQFVEQNTGDRTRSIHVLAVKGQVEKDDVLVELSTGLMWRVTNLDSKSRSPRENKSKWAKVPMEFIQFGETEPE